MKNIFTLLLAFIAFNSFSQVKPMKIEIDSMVFELKQKIEIDGHIIKEPVYFKASLDGIEIYDKNNNQYQRRKCKSDKCGIIHLEQKNIITSEKIILNNNPNWYTTAN